MRVPVHLMSRSFFRMTFFSLFRQLFQPLSMSLSLYLSSRDRFGVRGAGEWVGNGCRSGRITIRISIKTGATGAVSSPTPPSPPMEWAVLRNIDPHEYSSHSLHSYRFSPILTLVQLFVCDLVLQKERRMRRLRKKPLRMRLNKRLKERTTRRK